jgi:nitrous oxide reductase accessory protein NosL
MSRLLTLALAALSLLIPAGALAADDVQSGPTCGHCGMDREKFAHSRMLIQYEDGSKAATCSLHCAAVELALAIDKTPKEILVGDYVTKELIEAETATWVVGGKLSGVMSRNAKWAFRDRTEAEKFIAANGGALASFDDVIKASYTEMYEDTKMIRERRRMRRAK